MPTSLKPERSPRPWRKDAKWLSGLVLLVVLGSALFFAVLARVTEERPAVDMMTRLIAASLSRHGLDDDTELAAFKKAARLKPNDSLKPIPFLNVTISNQDILAESPRELRLGFFQQFATAIYRDGPEGLAALATDREIKKSIVEGGSMLKLLTAESHAWLERILLPLILLAALLFMPLIFFSAGFGRLVSPGLILLLAGTPGFTLFYLLAKVIPTNPPSILSSQASTMDMITFVASYALPIILPIAKNIYGTATVVGLALLLGALLGKIGLKVAQRLSRHNTV